ncbi:E3 ubiquitin-protein ligase UHRF1-like [Euwallacea fornicatus]|uniref:E3 ubiquitin-protein ligase UHRF1-like n=1 Tax=Euwallacea fornicatus TaxID=995702 RepID=UPI00338F82B5
MYIRIKADWLEDRSKRECVIPLSKVTPIQELRMLVEEEIGLEPKLQRLFYKGKELVDGQILNDYSVIQNDVIVVMKRHIIAEAGENVPSTPVKDNKSDITQPVSNERLVDSESQYYKIGDPIDVKLLDSGAWYEGIIDKILLKGDEAFDESQLIFRIKSAEHASVIPFEEDAQYENVRPRSYYTYKIPELKPGMTVLANFNIDSPKERGLWYDFNITKVGSVDIIGTIYIGGEPIDNCNIKFIQECMRIEKPLLLSERSEHPPKLTKRKYPYHCSNCKDEKKRSCKYCGCHICGGKQDWDKIILCDECDLGYHTDCLDPPMEAVPEDDWYCPSCKTDDSSIVKAGEKLKISKKRQNMPSNKTDSKRDWGRGMACAGLAKTNDKVSKSHVGSIPGVEVGFSWKFRIGVSESGVHRPPVAGMHGQESDCAYSVVLSGGYEDDVDYGNEFLYTGSGGRDLSGNKRTSNQSCDQELTRTNKALALNCNAKFDDKNGAIAENWKGGKPVRVVRSYKLAKHSKYAPEDGFRYDGLYKVVKYYPEKGKSGHLVWRYLLRRDDPAPAPWEKGGKQYDMIYPEGYLQMVEAKRKKEQENNNPNTLKRGKKRKPTVMDLVDIFNKKKKVNKFELGADTLKAIDEDIINKKLWTDCKAMANEGKKEFLEKVEEVFKCIICIELIFNPLTLKCGHTFCKNCLEDSIKHCSDEEYECPHCREKIGKKNSFVANQYKNEKLQTALNLLFPGYGTN